MGKPNSAGQGTKISLADAVNALYVFHRLQFSLTAFIQVFDPIIWTKHILPMTRHHSLAPPNLNNETANRKRHLYLKRSAFEN